MLRNLTDGNFFLENRFKDNFVVNLNKILKYQNKNNQNTMLSSRETAFNKNMRSFVIEDSCSKYLDKLSRRKCRDSSNVYYEYLGS